ARRRLRRKALAARDVLRHLLAQHNRQIATPDAPAVVGDLPAAVAGGIDGDDAGAVQLAEDRAPFVAAVLLADAKSAQPLMLPFEDVFGLLAEQQASEMFGAEPLAGAHDRRERLLGGNCAVDHLGAFEADVAIAATARGLTEIGKQPLSSAARRLAQRHQRIEAGALDPLLLLGGFALVDLHATQPDVAHAVERERIGRQPVAAGAADLLVVA